MHFYEENIAVQVTWREGTRLKGCGAMVSKSPSEVHAVGEPRLHAHMERDAPQLDVSVLSIMGDESISLVELLERLF